MYNLIIKENGPELDLIITRAMLALAAIAAMVYRTDEYYYLNLLSAAILLITAVFTKFLLIKYKINYFVLLVGASAILFFATRSISFAVILLVYGFLVKFLYKGSSIVVTKEGVVIKKFFGSPLHHWNEFSNIILKDNLLTLDFKNNKLIQVNIDETKVNIDENAFNKFCNDFI